MGVFGWHRSLLRCLSTLIVVGSLFSGWAALRLCGHWWWSETLRDHPSGRVLALLRAHSSLLSPTWFVV